MKIEPNTIETIELASLLYQSLVDFVAEGNIMDSETVKQTCTILQKIADNIGRTAWTHRLLFELVPTRDDSCSGFTESIVSLLTSSNEKLVNLQFFKTNTLSIYLLRSLKKGLRAWRKEGPAVQKRGQQIMAKLREEGISDEIELPFQHSVLFNDRRHNIFLGIQLIDLIDGNVPYLGEMEIHE
ncbi:hypothetical protein BLNAU_16186 [Blattamonas nauphoetae]|uniref:Uncharacterized protein n=1 Tax=Blattamonas nauphoetae TaxID=2049346 RepID=A0ABQ9XC51_9EUKA|nr:hypothetical protein BLNAU_16186 [Blattamonas nauphoetae]